MTDPEYTPTADEAATIASIETFSKEKQLQVASFTESVMETMELLSQLGETTHSEKLDRLLADFLIAGVEHIKDAPEFQG